MAGPSHFGGCRRSRADHLCSADSLVAGTYRRLASRRDFVASHSIYRFSACVYQDSLASLENISTLGEADCAGFLCVGTYCWNNYFHAIRVQHRKGISIDVRGFHSPGYDKIPV